MNILYFFRLIRKHIVVLIVLPLLMGAFTILLTSKPKFTYTSQTVLYTGLVTGSSIEMDKSFNYFLTNSAFDNLINIINSRETLQEVAIRLLAQHLMLEKPDVKFIGPKAFNELREITPPYIYKYVARSGRPLMPADSNFMKHSDYYHKYFPGYLNPIDYELTVSNLTALMKSSDTNFVYKLLNFDFPRYSLKALSAIKAQRIANSDLLKITYEVDDPGVCQQTLALLNQVCIKNYKSIRGNRSEDVVKYFEEQLAEANAKLKMSEDRLLEFNRSNNIINYYEQSKAVAGVKEEMEVDYNNKKAQLSGLEATIKKLEEKLSIQQSVQLKSGTLLEKKKQLGEINYAIANLEADNTSDPSRSQQLLELKKQAGTLEQEIRKSVEELYTYQNTVDGLPVNTLLNEWLRNVIEAESLRAKLRVMDQRNKEFQQQYAIYAPAGANMKRIEREISVSEQGYLEILHALNLAKLKLQDSEIASELKLVDPPYYPLSPEPTKRKVLVILATLLGGMLVLGTILLTDYFDNTIKNAKRGSKQMKAPALGLMPKIYLKPGVLQFNHLLERLIQIITRNIITALGAGHITKHHRRIIFLSTQAKEGKTFLAGNISKELVKQGHQVAFYNFSAPYEVQSHSAKFSLFRRLFGYQDPRIDTGNVFLQHPSSYLPENVYHELTYQQADAMSMLKNTHESIPPQESHRQVTLHYDIIELPSLIHHDYPDELIADADLVVLVARANREWTEADNAAMENVKNLAADKIRVIVNGTEIQELESVLGELPKKRSRFRQALKNILRFQYYTQQKI